MSKFFEKFNEETIKSKSSISSKFYKIFLILLLCLLINLFYSTTSELFLWYISELISFRLIEAIGLIFVFWFSDFNSFLTSLTNILMLVLPIHFTYKTFWFFENGKYKVWFYTLFYILLYVILFHTLFYNEKFKDISTIEDIYYWICLIWTIILNKYILWSSDSKHFIIFYLIIFLTILEKNYRLFLWDYLLSYMLIFIPIFLLSIPVYKNSNKFFKIFIQISVLILLLIFYKWIFYPYP